MSFFAAWLAPLTVLSPLLAEVIVLKGKASESETDHLTSTGSQAPQLASTVSAV